MKALKVRLSIDFTQILVADIIFSQQNKAVKRTHITGVLSSRIVKVNEAAKDWLYIGFFQAISKGN